ncbi:MAG: hypothetical protein ACI9UO_002910 [Nitrospinales bacterium]|jgi:hypothetical protein
MNKLFINKTIRLFTLPLKNSRGMAALISVVMSLVIIAALAFNFLAESRQKQTGAILTYTSINASLISEAGLRFIEKCMVDVEASWQCPTALQNEKDWAENINQSNNILGKSFAGGTFSIYFPGTSEPANLTGSPNDADNLRVISVGTYKGATRSLTRFINRKCVGVQYAVTSCNNLQLQGDIINPVSPEDGDGDPNNVCTLDPPGLVSIPAYTENFTDYDCDTGCNGSDSECPNFDKNNGSHYETSTKLLKYFKFCEMTIDDIEVRTSVNTTADNNIYVAKILEIKGNNGLLNLSYDSLSPYEYDDTSITVYKEFIMKDKAKVQVQGTLNIRVVEEFKMEEDSEVNASQGDPHDVILLAENKVELNDDAKFYGAILADGNIDVEDDAYVNGWIKSNKRVNLKKDAVIDHYPSAGSSNEGSQCETIVKWWTERD